MPCKSGGQQIGFLELEGLVEQVLDFGGHHAQPLWEPIANRQIGDPESRGSRLRLRISRRREKEAVLPDVRRAHARRQAQRMMEVDLQRDPARRYFREQLQPRELERPLESLIAVPRG